MAAAAPRPIERVIWQQEEGVYGKLTQPFQIGEGMCGPTVMAYGSEEHKRHYLPKLASGEQIWCQLFSEPAGGSDVAGLRTRAEKNGDDWIVNGQKIWTSGAHYSDYGLLITRTDPNVPKHKGLTMFFLDMKSPGVEVRPIKQANGMQEFNEVYFTDVVIPDSQRLGAVGDGWNVSLTTLMNERMSIGARLATGFPEMFEFCSNLMTEDGLAIDDRATRSKLANWAVKASGLKYTSYRAISALSKGERPGPENSIGKLVAGTMLQDIATYAMDLEGAAGVFTGDDEDAGARPVPADAAEFAVDPHRRRHRRDPAQHHRRARARPARRHPRRQGRAVQQDPDQGTMNMADAADEAAGQPVQRSRNGSACSRNCSASAIRAAPSCRDAGAARDHRACADGGAAHRVVVQQPALAGPDRERRGQGTLSQG